MSEETPVIEAPPVIEATPPQPDPTKAAQFVADNLTPEEMTELLSKTYEQDITLTSGKVVKLSVNMPLLQSLLLKLDHYSIVWKLVGNAVVDELGLRPLLGMVGIK